MPSERGSHPPEPARVPVDIRRFPWIRKLAADYAFQFSAVAPFYSGDPSSAQAWTDAIERTQRHTRARSEIAAVLAAQQARRNSPAAARTAATLLKDPKTVAIVTGQQAGLFGGPAFTLYKILTAVKLAKKVAADYGVSAVPVFWVEAEDHDWDEVASCAVLDGEFRRQTIALPPRAGHGAVPVGHVTLGDEIVAAVDQLAATFAPTEFTAELIAHLRASYEPGRGMADAFSRWIEHLTGDMGVVVFDCSDKAAKPLAGQIFAREVAQPGRTWQLAGEAGERLEASGYHAQVAGTGSHAAALFRIDGIRSAVETSDAAALTDAVRDKPETFSPNVLLRPIVQDTLFPTACYVTGPNELAYLGQLRRVYEHFDVPMPLFYPRGSLTVTDSASARFLARHDLPFEALHARDESALNRLLAASLPEEVDRALRQASDAIETSMAALIAAVPAVDPTLEGAAKSTLGKLEHDISSLRGKVISAAKKRDETLRRQFYRAQAQAFPDGIPQERAVGAIWLINRYGTGIVQRLLEELPLDPGHHWVLTL